MFFLLMFAAVIPVAIIDAPLPKIAATADEVKKAKENENNKLDLMVYINPKALVVKSDLAGQKEFPRVGENQYAYAEFHKYLVTLKQKRPQAKELTLMPTDETTYDVMIEVMDQARELNKEDPGFQVVPQEASKNADSFQYNRLFPDVSIGGV
jgi:biopolymer transport protein ExbD